MATSDKVGWFLLIGCLMLARGLAATTIARLPFTSAIVYLGVGLVLGPLVLAFSVSIRSQSHLLEVLTEIAVLISLFSAGVKMPVPFSPQTLVARDPAGLVSMTISVGLIAAFGCLVLGLPLGAAVLLGAILAPTDPVLATDVQVRHAGDKRQAALHAHLRGGHERRQRLSFRHAGPGLAGHARAR
jgi:NhaP-type Na+/H+ or K+/H+ antiporter